MSAAGRRIGGAAGLLLCVAGCGPVEEAPFDLVIEGATVLTMDGAALDDHSVYVRDGRITAVVPSAQPLPGPAGTTVDGAGLFVAPGLVDAHAHVPVRSDLERYLVSGVTSVREMWGLPRELRWRDAIREGRMPGPNLVVASTFFWMDGPEGTKHVDPATPDSARALVRRVAADGYDLVKVVSVTDHDVLRALVDEASTLGLGVSGHYPDRSVPLDTMLEMGMATFEHADEFATVAFGGDATDEEIRDVGRALARRGVGLTTILSPARTYLEIDERGADALPWQERLEVLDRLGAHHFRSATSTIDNVVAAGGAYTEQWRAGTALALRAARIFLDEGVNLAVGTEGVGPFFTGSGVGVYEELALLAGSGVPAETVLRIATVGGATMLGFADRKGRVREGYDADLVLLPGDPRIDLEVLRRPHAVVVMGRYYGPADLQALARVY